MEIVERIGKVAMAVYAVMISYQALYLVLGFFAKSKTFPPAGKTHSYGIVIAARNEERVIGNLLESIHQQDYDPALIKVFVVADNCSDNTAEICRRHGAVVYERRDKEHARKGYALEFLFENIRRDFGIESVDAYIFFDADNLLKRDFVTQMNNAFDSCGDIVVGYRNTKNFGTNFISAAYGLHFYRSTMSMHRPRSVLRQSTHIAGTGYAVSSRLLREGWHWTCLTEDTELSMNAVSRGIKIDFCEAAEFYDEQPYSLDVMLRQRIRWAKGRLAVFFTHAHRLVSGVFRCETRRFSCYDMFFYILPKALLTALASILYTAVTSAVSIASGAAGGGVDIPALLAAVPGLITALGLSWLRLALLGALVAVRERRHIHCGNLKLAIYVLIWPFFDLTGLPISLVSLLMRVKWKPIRHDQDIAIEDLENGVK